jgi:Ion channel
MYNTFIGNFMSAWTDVDFLFLGIVLYSTMVFLHLMAVFWYFIAAVEGIQHSWVATKDLNGAAAGPCLPCFILSLPRLLSLSLPPSLSPPPSLPPSPPPSLPLFSSSSFSSSSSPSRPHPRTLCRLVQVGQRLRSFHRIRPLPAALALLFHLEKILPWIVSVNKRLSGWERAGVPLENLPYWQQYIASLHFVTVTVTTIGYGDVSPNTPLEQIVSIFMMLIGVVFFGIVITSSQ